MHATDRSVFFSSYYLEAGRIAAGEGHYERACALMKRGLVHAQTSLRTRQAAIPLTLGLASAYLERGDCLSAPLALDLLPKRIDAARQPGYAVQELELRAKLDLLQGQLGAAKEKLERVLSICRRGNFTQAQAKASLNLAYVLIFLNQTARAVELCETLRCTAQLRRDPATETRADFLIHFAFERGQSLVSGVAVAYSVAEMQGALAPREPKPHPARWRTPFDLPPAPNFLTLFEERALGFYWHLGRCDWPAARAYLRQLEEVFIKVAQPTDSLLIHQRLAALDCMLAYYEGDFAAARAGLETVVAVVRRMGLKPELWQLLRFFEWANARLGNVAAAERSAREAEQINQ
ncbi:MAG TPA: hypothetical protein VE775_08845, partial [Pyrinomonadaceae bacterium]|nr:hypothetical protein [Pyrinomonadaceae bacterium]